jgi:hypothetical protein
MRAVTFDRLNIDQKMVHQFRRLHSGDRGADVCHEKAKGVSVCEMQNL